MRALSPTLCNWITLYFTLHLYYICKRNVSNTHASYVYNRLCSILVYKYAPYVCTYTHALSLAIYISYTTYFMCTYVDTSINL